MVPGLHVPVQAAWDSKQASAIPRIALSRSCVSYHRPLSNPNRDTIAVRQENVMKTKVWTRPEVKEIHLGCEINSYAPAEI
jgi:coenzyme PQQ precursor peptide PqqA